MKKTLYVSDLDGTLLSSGGGLSPYTRDFLQQFIKKGGLFTIATARNIQQTRRIMADIPLNVPIIVNNGLGIYDLQQNQFLHIHPLPGKYIEEITALGKKMGFSVFLYALKESEITLFYLPLQDEAEAAYIHKREGQYPNHCIPVTSFEQVPPQQLPLYMIVYGEKEKVFQVQPHINAMDEIYGIASEDVYGNYYFLDIIPKGASKANAVRTLKDFTGAQEIVAFGDNFNDIEMLKAAHRAYVPENGRWEAKKVATATILKNTEDGVARFIEKDTAST